jgi:hypothetical protein
MPLAVPAQHGGARQVLLALEAVAAQCEVGGVGECDSALSGAILVARLLLLPLVRGLALGTGHGGAFQERKGRLALSWN